MQISKCSKKLQCLLSFLFIFSRSFALTQTFVITHAAGRMGKLLASQIREGALLYGDNHDSPTPVKIRAVVRSDEEAKSVLCDLAGMVTRDGITSHRETDWLETVVIGDISLEENVNRLEKVFDGATGAVLCDASHNELVQSEEDGKWSLRVPGIESKEHSNRLSAEIDAATKSKSLEHVILRSSMGLFLNKRGLDFEWSPSQKEVIIEAVKAMGGDEALLGPRRAEEALESSGLDFSILRLGALTDDAGMIPLAFGTDDSLLVQWIEGQKTRRPPVLSRADAARIASFMLRERKLFMKKRLVIDCAWLPKWGSSSVGTEEALIAASKQDLIGDINSACSRKTTSLINR